MKRVSPGWYSATYDGHTFVAIWQSWYSCWLVKHTRDGVTRATLLPTLQSVHAFVREVRAGREVEYTFKGALSETA